MIIADSLAKGLQDFYDTKELWLSKRTEICAWTRRTYSYESMRDRFIDVINSISA